MESEDSDFWSEIELSNFFDPVSSPSSSSSSMVGAGLFNLGNTCFVNAVLQCLTHTVPIVQTLQCCDHPNPCPREIVEGFCVLCALRDHVDLSLALPEEAFAPYRLVDNLSYICSSFRGYRQQDAHEFLQCLLLKLDRCDCSDVHLKDQHDGLVKSNFGGLLRNQLRCTKCGYSWSKFDYFMDLSLEIEDVTNLESALESFTKAENIEDSKFSCKDCKDNVFVQKRCTIARTRSVVAFHLKRINSDGHCVQKIDKHVVYPLTLDLRPYSCDEGNIYVQLKYKLYAVVVHEGNSSSGHYLCYIRPAPRTWYMFNDSEVAEVSEGSALSQEAYILFYARESSPWFAKLMEDRKQNYEQLNLNIDVIASSPNSTQCDAIDTDKEPCVAEESNVARREELNRKRAANEILEEPKRKVSCRGGRSMPIPSDMKLSMLLQDSHVEDTLNMKKRKRRNSF